MFESDFMAQSHLKNILRQLYHKNTIDAETFSHIYLASNRTEFVRELFIIVPIYWCDSLTLIIFKAPDNTFLTNK